MTVIINGTTGIDTVQDGIVTDSKLTLTANSQEIKDAINASGSAPIYACRAWVNFDGTGTPAIRASGNVSSITDNGTGTYAVNYTNAMPDINYSIVSTSRNAGVGPTFSSTTTTATSSSFVGTYDAAGTLVDANNISVAVFR